MRAVRIAGTHSRAIRAVMRQAVCRSHPIASRPPYSRRSAVTRPLALVATLAMVATACTGGDTEGGTPVPEVRATPGELGDTLTVYSRDRDGALFDMFEQQTGIKVRARWGNFEDLAEQIIDEGADSPADVFYAPLSDALGLLSAAGRLARLADEQLDRVPEAYRSPDGTWVGTSGRALVVVYNTDRLSGDDLPDSILGFTDPAWRGRIGWDPANRALQGGITALRQLKGEDTARAWLQGIQANAPAVFDGPRPIINAVAAGTIIDVGFANHYYLQEQQPRARPGTSRPSSTPVMPAASSA
jgi:iron(III) transport system substrate-binding protein